MDRFLTTLADKEAVEPPNPTRLPHFWMKQIRSWTLLWVDGTVLRDYYPNIYYIFLIYHAYWHGLYVAGGDYLPNRHKAWRSFLKRCVSHRPRLVDTIITLIGNIDLPKFSEQNQCPSLKRRSRAEIIFGGRILWISLSVIVALSRPKCAKTNCFNLRERPIFH